MRYVALVLAVLLGLAVVAPISGSVPAQAACTSSDCD